MRWMARSLTEAWGIEMRDLWVSLRLACGAKFGAGLAGFVLLGAAAGFEDIVTAFRTEGLLTADYHFYLVKDILSSPTLMMAVPIAAALPYTACLVDALQSGFIRQPFGCLIEN